MCRLAQNHETPRREEGEDIDTEGFGNDDVVGILLVSWAADVIFRYKVPSNGKDKAMNGSQDTDATSQWQDSQRISISKSPATRIT